MPSPDARAQALSEAMDPGSAVGLETLISHSHLAGPFTSLPRGARLMMWKFDTVLALWPGD
jgi:hypothetical protein